MLGTATSEGTIGGPGRDEQVKQVAVVNFDALVSTVTLMQGMAGTLAKVLEGARLRSNPKTTTSDSSPKVLTGGTFDDKKISPPLVMRMKKADRRLSLVLRVKRDQVEVCNLYTPNPGNAQKAGISSEYSERLGHNRNYVTEVGEYEYLHLLL